jgi:hypothetical protein
METFVCGAGAFPLSRLESRLRCPDAGGVILWSSFNRRPAQRELRSVEFYRAAVTALCALRIF